MKYVYVIVGGLFQIIGAIAGFVWTSLHAGSHAHDRWLEKKLEEWT